MPTTTTIKAIRDGLIALIEAATPAVMPERAFRRAPRDQDFRTWARDAGSAALRAFVFEIEDQEPDPFTMPFETVERNETLVLTVAYPVLPALYGRDDRDDQEWTMRRDARQLRDLIFSSSAYQSGQSAAFPERQPFNRRDDRVWFLTFRTLCIYTEAQSLA